MKIILINTVCGQGSVGRIVADLYEAAAGQGMEAAVAYGRGGAAKDIRSYKIGSQSDFYRHVCRNFFRGEGGFGSAAQTKRFLDYLDQERPDVLHLHNLHGFYIQIELLFAYIKEKKIPAVWTFHDCWPFTGHCAYYEKNGCLRWQEDCHVCPFHKSAYPYALFCDNAAEGFRRKKAAFTGAENLVIVTPSKWLAGEVKKSFLRDYPAEVIPNGIDLTVFHPDQTAEPGTVGKPYTVLGVANVWEERKGLAFLEGLARELPSDYRIRLIGLSGRQKKRLEKQFPPDRLLAQERTADIRELAEAYREASVFVNPTLEDNFPTANLEALACGTPVVTFAAGGSPETIGISAGETGRSDCGICVEKGDAKALLFAVREVCEGENFGWEACRRQAGQYEKNRQYRQYTALYERLHEARRKGNGQA